MAPSPASIVAANAAGSTASPLTHVGSGPRSAAGTAWRSPNATVAPLPALYLLAPGVPRSSRGGSVVGRVSPGPSPARLPIQLGRFGGIHPDPRLRGSRASVATAVRMSEGRPGQSASQRPFPPNQPGIPRMWMNRSCLCSTSAEYPEVTVNRWAGGAGIPPGYPHRRRRLRFGIGPACPSTAGRRRGPPRCTCPRRLARRPS